MWSQGSSVLWFRSYFAGNTKRIISGDPRKPSVAVLFSVPQGSVLGLLLHLPYTADIFFLFVKHHLRLPLRICKPVVQATHALLSDILLTGTLLTTTI